MVTKPDDYNDTNVVVDAVEEVNKMSIRSRRNTYTTTLFSITNKRGGVEGCHVPLEVVLPAECPSTVLLAADELLDTMRIMNNLMGFEIVVPCKT